MNTSTTGRGQDGNGSGAEGNHLYPGISDSQGIDPQAGIPHDWSDQNSFNGGKDKNQHTIALGVMYTW